MTGRFVHPAETINEQLVLSATEAAPPFASIVANAPPALAEVVDRALAFHKEDRWPDAGSMQHAVREVVDRRHFKAPQRQRVGDLRWRRGHVNEVTHPGDEQLHRFGILSTGPTLWPRKDGNTKPQKDVTKPRRITKATKFASHVGRPFVLFVSFVPS